MWLEVEEIRSYRTLKNTRIEWKLKFWLLITTVIGIGRDRNLLTHTERVEDHKMEELCAICLLLFIHKSSVLFFAERKCNEMWVFERLGVMWSSKNLCHRWITKGRRFAVDLFCLYFRRVGRDVSSGPQFLLQLLDFHPRQKIL